MNSPRLGGRFRMWVAWLALVLLPTQALAHTALTSSSPASGAHLYEAPRELRLRFNEAVEIALARLALVGPGGTEIGLGELRNAPDSATVVIAAIERLLSAGVYTVRWQVAGADGHPVRGEFSFMVEPEAAGLVPDSAAAPVASLSDAGPTAPGQEAPPAQHHLRGASNVGFDSGSPLYAAVRWLTFTGLLVVIGVVSFALLLLPSLRRRNPSLRAEVLSRARLQAARVGLIAGAILAVALVLRFFAQSAALHGPEAAWVGELTGVMLTRTLWGWGWILQATATAMLVRGLWLARKGRAGGWGLAGVATLGLAATPALSGHAAATSALAVVSDSLHVLAAGGWLGTLLLVMVVGLPVLLHTTESRTVAAASLLGAFSPLALTFAAVLTLTGVYAAWLHLPDIAALWSSAYGRTLLLKLAALSVVFGTGAYNWLRARPVLEKSGNLQPLKRSAGTELAVGVLVLAITAALVATPPPVEGESLAAQTGSDPVVTAGPGSTP